MGTFRGSVAGGLAGAWVAALLLASPAAAFVTNGRWSSTATDGPTSPTGLPVTVTWSIVPNGTFIQGEGNSNLLSFLDAQFGAGPGGSDLTQRPWFPDVESAFDRWNELSGINFVYEPVDDGKNLGQWAGLLGSRGDIRLGGANLDGPGGSNAQTAFLDNGDITIDTSDVAYYTSQVAGFPANLPLRNTLAHEIGHALGLGHSDSNNAKFLMEGAAENVYDGPQFDDVRGVQQLYGDVFEKSNNFAGNGTLPNATPLGAIGIGGSQTIGLDSTTGTVVDAADVDFLSISNSNDLDFFSFTVDVASLVGITLTPVGPNYNERSGINYVPTQSSRASDLNLQLYSLVEGNPVLLGSASSSPLGQPELLSDVLLPAGGQYFVRVAGSTSTVQTYKLLVGVAAVPGDFNGDGAVDGADLLTWQQGYGPTYDDQDLADWEQNYGFGGVAAAVGAIPEPATAPLLLAAVLLLASREISRRNSRSPTVGPPDRRQND